MAYLRGQRQGRGHRRTDLKQFAGFGVAHEAAAIDGLDREVWAGNAGREDLVAKPAREHRAAFKGRARVYARVVNAMMTLQVDLDFNPTRLFTLLQQSFDNFYPKSTNFRSCPPLKRAQKL